LVSQHLYPKKNMTKPCPPHNMMLYFKRIEGK